MRRLDGKPKNYPSKIKINNLTVREFAELTGHPIGQVYADFKRGYCTLHDSRSKKHPMYRRWMGMKQRCYNKASTAYSLYGQRGVQVCSRWLHHKDGFWNFVKDMGPCPPGMSLDRIDNDGDYSPENCRWATQKEQTNNQSTNHLVEYNKQSYTIAELAELHDIKPNTLLYRLRRGWTVGEAITGYRDKKYVNILGIRFPYQGSLTEHDLTFIVEARQQGLSTTAIGKQLGIDGSQVCRIWNRVVTYSERYGVPLDEARKRKADIAKGKKRER